MYNYDEQRHHVFEPENQKMFLSIRDRAHKLIHQAGVARMDKIIEGETGVNWEMFASVDRLVELGEIHEIDVSGIAVQYRMFTHLRIEKARKELGE